MCDARAARKLIQHVLSQSGSELPTLILDAAALESFETVAAAAAPYPAGVVLTPHAGEMAKMWSLPRSTVSAYPLEIAREASAQLGAIVALKGAHTYVVAPDGTAYRNTAGNLGLGTSGSGDTLSGVIAGLCARGAPPLQAATWGVYLHARAGDVLARRIGPLGFLARELLSEIPPLLHQLGPT